MKLNKTQKLLIERLYGKHGEGSYIKKGWAYNANLKMISLYKLNEIDQALKLAEKYPDNFKCQYVCHRNYKLYAISECKFCKGTGLGQYAETKNCVECQGKGYKQAN